MRSVNKAFCREPDAQSPRCPGCGADGSPVAPETVAAHVAAGAAEQLGEPAYCCLTESCSVAYFDLFERSIPLAEAHGFFWPKDPAGPLCACHGLTCDDIDADVAEGQPRRVRAVVERAGASDAECSHRAADGRTCLPRVQREYMRRHRG
ncbi:MAG: hypothetical protein ACOYK7_16280 [Pirellulales bacterium]